MVLVMLRRTDGKGFATVQKTKKPSKIILLEGLTVSKSLTRNAATMQERPPVPHFLKMKERMDGEIRISRQMHKQQQ